jgi:hypothetical protein
MNAASKRPKRPVVSKRSRQADADKFEWLLGFARGFQKQRLALDLAGIFFVAATEHANAGDSAYARLETKLREFRNVFAELGSLQRKVAARKALCVVTDDHLIDSLQELRRVELLYEPVVRDYALAVVAAVASAEMFINEVAEVVIEGRSGRELFDKLPVQAK